jgi:hypothetical protein
LPGKTRTRRREARKICTRRLGFGTETRSVQLQRKIELGPDLVRREPRTNWWRCRNFGTGRRACGRTEMPTLARGRTARNPAGGGGKPWRGAARLRAKTEVKTGRKIESLPGGASSGENRTTDCGAVRENEKTNPSAILPNEKWAGPQRASGARNRMNPEPEIYTEP